MELFGYDLKEFVIAAGYLGIFGIIFSESGVLIGLFFPGDSLLFTAGFLASQGFFNIYLLAIGAFVSAVLGDNFGYTFGRKIGPKIFRRKDSFLLHKDHIEKTKRFYEKHGAKAIVLARFLPVVRTLTPILAGVGEMRYKIFLTYNIIGALIWVIGISLFGYFLGNVIPEPDKYLLPAVIVIIILSMLPTIIHLLKGHKKKAVDV